MNVLFVVTAALLGFFTYRWQRKAAIARRGRLIDSYRFPQRISARLLQTYPHLEPAQAARVVDGLREYFHVCNMAGKALVAMPSQVVDVAWHEFILFTRQYEQFCTRALGRFLHHTPAEAMTAPTVAQDGIRRAWKICCHRESITPDKPTRLPRLFALDAELGIPDGFRYSLNCKQHPGQSYCASHIGYASGCGGGCAGDSGSGDGCGGGCGGD